MRRSLGRIPISSATNRQPFSTSSSGRGRGLGGDFPNEFYIAPPKPDYPKDESLSGDGPHPSLPPLGHGRGKPVPSFFSFVNSSLPSSAGSGGVSGPTKPISHDFTPSPPTNPSTSHTPEETNLPSIVLSVLSGAGRGKPLKTPEPTADKSKQQENRHIQPPRQVQGTFATDGATPASTRAPQPQRLSPEEAVKKAVGILSRGDNQGGSGAVRGGKRRFRVEKGREREVQFDADDDDSATGLYLGDDADGEKLAKRLGPDTTNKLVEAFEEMSATVLPSVADDVYLDALHTNLMIECEPEYLMGEFDQNPDIDEKPPIPLRDALDKMKPFLMAYEGIQSQQEWDEAVQEIMERVPLIKEIVDHYSGPDRVTAKQQQEELERVANTLPKSAPDSVKRFTERAVLSLQSNPGWGFDKKCQFMDKLVWEVSQQY